MQLLLTISRLVDGRTQILGTIRADKSSILPSPNLEPLMVRLIPHYFPFLNPGGMFEQLAGLPSIVTMPTGHPLLIDKQWLSS